MSDNQDTLSEGQASSDQNNVQNIIKERTNQSEQQNQEPHKNSLFDQSQTAKNSLGLFLNKKNHSSSNQDNQQKTQTNLNRFNKQDDNPKKKVSSSSIDQNLFSNINSGSRLFSNSFQSPSPSIQNNQQNQSESNLKDQNKRQNISNETINEPKQQVREPQNEEQEKIEEQKDEIILRQSENREEKKTLRFKKYCLEHPDQEIILIRTDADATKLLNCNYCVSGVGPVNSLSLDMIVGNQNIVRNLPEFEKDSKFFDNINSALEEKNYQNRIKDKINDFFTNFKNKINQNIDQKQNEMLSKFDGLIAYRQQIQETYDKVICRKDLKQMFTNDYDINQAEAQMKKIMKSINDNKNSAKQEIERMIQNFETQDKSINFDQAKKIEQVIHEEIKNINMFQISDYEYLSQTNYYQQNKDFYNNELFDKDVNELTTSQLMMRLMSNKTNNCSPQLISKLQDLMAKLQGFIDNHGIRSSDYNKDLLKVNYNKLDDIQLKTVQQLSESFINKKADSDQSKQIKSDSLFGGFIDKNKNKNQNFLMKLIQNKFNNCDPLFTDYIKNELQRISPFIESLDFSELMCEQILKDSKIFGSKLSDEEVKQVNQLIESLEARKLSNEFIQTKAIDFNLILQNETNNISQQFINNFSQCMNNYPNILANLLLQQPIFIGQKKPIHDFNGLKEYQKENLIKLAQKINDLTQTFGEKYTKTKTPIIYQQIQSLKFREQIKTCLNKDALDKLLVDYPIFDLENLFINKVEFEFQATQKFENFGIKIGKTDTNNNIISQATSNMAQIVTKCNLRPDLNYVFRIKFSKNLDLPLHNGIAVGMIQEQNVDSQFIYKEKLCFRSNRIGLNQIMKGLNLYDAKKEIDCIEVRFSQKSKTLLFADYPNYQHVNKANPENIQQDQKYRLGILLDMPGDNFWAEIEEIFIVQDHELDDILSKKEEDFEDVISDNEDQEEQEFYLPPVRIFAEELKKKQEQEKQLEETNRQQEITEKQEEEQEETQIKPEEQQAQTENKTVKKYKKKPIRRKIKLIF